MFAGNSVILYRFTSRMSEEKERRGWLYVMHVEDTSSPSGSQTTVGVSRALKIETRIFGAFLIPTDEEGGKTTTTIARIQK